MNTFTAYATTLALVMVSGCGGGGGGSGGSGGAGADPTVPNTAIVLNLNNAAPVSNEASTEIGKVQSVGALAPSAGVTTSRSQTSLGTSTRVMLQQVVELSKVSQLPASPSAVQQSSVTPCAGGGNITSVIDRAARTASITFANCVDGSGTGNGRATLTNLDVTGSTVHGDMVADLSQAFSGSSVRIRATMTIDATVSGLAFSLDFSGNRLFIEGPGIVESYRAFNIQLDQDASGNTVLSGSTDYASVKMGGQVHIAISPPFHVFANSNFPDTGAMLISDNRGAAIRVTVLGNENLSGDQVKFEEDIDGVQGFEKSRLVKWSDIKF